MHLHFRTLLALTIGMVLAGCAQPVSSTQSQRLADVPKVSAVRVAFDSQSPTKTRVSSTTYLPGDEQEAARTLHQYVRTFSADFVSRFPMIAAQHGLTVTPTADYQLEFRFPEQHTSCLPRCKTFMIVSASLLTPQKVPVWKFETKLWQLRAEDGVDDTTFDNLANEVLRSMQTDGLLK